MTRMPPPVHPDLRALWPRLDAGGGAVRLDGEPLPYDPGDLVRSLDGVAWRLYLRWYTRAGDGAPFPHPPDAYAEALRRLGAGRDRWERDWVVRLALDDGAVLAEKHARRQWVRPGGYVVRNPHGGPQVGAHVDLFLPGVAERLQQSFVHFFGRVPWENDPGLDTLRIYLSFPPGPLLQLLDALLPALDAHYVPYRIKVLRDADDFARADTGVLYVEDRHVPLVLRLVAAAGGREARPGPRMVAAVGPGVGMAEDPPGGASFGLTRCHTLAWGLSRLLDGPRAGAKAAAAVALAALREEGVDPARPWLDPRSHRGEGYRRWLGFPGGSRAR